MEVLAITYCRAMFGANRAMVAMIKDMRDRYSVRFTVLMPFVVDGDLEEVLISENIPYIVAPMKMWVMPALAKLKRLRSLSAELKSNVLYKGILKQIRDRKFDLIYTNNSTVQYGALLSEKLHIPHVWHVREFGRRDYDIVFSYPKKKRVGYFRKAAKVIAISDSIKDYADTDLCPGVEIKRIYDGISLYKRLKTAFNKDKPLKVVCSGALQSGKNQLELLMAVSGLINNGESEFEIYLIGDGNEYKDTLKSYVKEHDIEKYIHFMGYREDVRNLLDDMDLGVICSKSEGFGLVTCEYMESSMPVIGAATGGTIEIIDDNETGFLYPVGDINALAEKIKYFINNRDALESMGRKAYEKVYRDFSLERNTDEMYKVFNESLREK